MKKRCFMYDPSILQLQRQLSTEIGPVIDAASTASLRYETSIRPESATVTITIIYPRWYRERDVTNQRQIDAIDATRRSIIDIIERHRSVGHSIMLIER